METNEFSTDEMLSFRYGLKVIAARIARLSPSKKVRAAMAVAVNVMVPKHRTIPTVDGAVFDKKSSSSDIVD
jgi:hypothetical protein